MSVAVVRTQWSGTSGGPGLSQTFMQDTATFGQFTGAQAQAAVNAVRTFWDAIKAYLPDDIVLTVSPTVDQYDVVSGELLYSTTAATAPTAVVGTSAGTYAMASGIKVNLATGVIRNGRRVRGALFIVPATSSVYTSNGLVASATRTAINTAGAAMISGLATSSLQPVVYSRPLPAGVPNGPRSGEVSPVSVMETNEKGAILRGRRD